jgi:hypothetical protein
LRLNSAVWNSYRFRYLLLDMVDFVGGEIENVGVPIRRTEHKWPGVSASRAFLGPLVDQATAKKEETVRLVRVIFYEPPKFRVAYKIRENEKGNRPTKSNQYPAQPAHFPLSRYKG